VSIRCELEDEAKKDVFDLSELHHIAQAAQQADDTLRHIVAILLNTGARCAEIVGLQTADVVLEHEIPHIVIQPHLGLVRTLKNAASKRKVPLVGVSLWAAERAVASSTGRSGLWLFPKYVTPDQSRAFIINSGSANAAANKWLKATLQGHKTCHSFRHTLKDRLSAVGASEETYGPIGGWGSPSVAQKYGDRFGLPMLRVYRKHLDAISI
jgi:integrase